MNRKEIRGGGSRRGNDTDMRRKEKENRKLQLELRSEKEKLNSAIIKYQKEINEMQAVGATLLRKSFELYVLLLHMCWTSKNVHFLFFVVLSFSCSNCQKKVRCV